MLPDFKLLLIDSLPAVREGLSALHGRPGPLAIVEAYQDLPQALEAARRDLRDDRPALALVPLTAWAGQEPTAIADSLLEFIDSPERCAALQQKLAETCSKLGGLGAHERAAKAVAGWLVI